MANYPASLDALDNPTETTRRNDPGHELHSVISTLNDIAEALETKLGIGSTAPASAVGGALQARADGSTTWAPVRPQNKIVNGDGVLDPETGPYTSTGSRNNDDKYVCGLFTLLSDGNNVVNVSQETTTIPAGGRAAVKLTWVTANKRAGLVYFLEAADARDLIGDVCSVSFRAATTSAKVINNVRCSVLSWTGTADALTSDVVSGTSWGASGSDPTLAASWTLENTPSNLAVSTTYTRHTVENVAIDAAGAKNVAIFIYTNDTDAAVGDELFITDLSLVKGAVAVDAQKRPVAEEELLMLRYHERWRCDSNARPIGIAQAFGTASCVMAWQFKAAKRTVPAISAHGTGAGTNGFAVSTASSAHALTASFNGTIQGGIYAYQIAFLYSGGAAAASAVLVDFDPGVPAAYLDADARL